MLKRVIHRLSNRVGLLSGGEVQKLQRRLARAEQAVAKADRARAKAERAIAKADDRTQRRAKLAAASDEGDEKRSEWARLVAERLPEIERTAIHVREQLMAVEVKLDMIEGAITVLDTRTRAALAAPERRGRPASDTLAASHAEQPGAAEPASLDGTRRDELPTREAARADAH